MPWSNNATRGQRHPQRESSQLGPPADSLNAALQSISAGRHEPPFDKGIFICSLNLLLQAFGRDVVSLHVDAVLPPVCYLLFIPSLRFATDLINSTTQH